MNDSSSAAFFEAIARRYDRVYGLDARLSKVRMQRVIAALPTSPSSILDLGVGTGRELASLQDAGHSPTGFDASPQMLEQCRRRTRPVPLVQGDFWKPLPFGNEVFDSALALYGTLSHPPNAQAIGALAAELARVLRPGGIFIFEVPAPTWLDAVGTIGNVVSDAERGTSVERLDQKRCRHTDLITGASIEATILDESEWRAELRPWFEAQLSLVDGFELFAVARRTAK